MSRFEELRKQKEIINLRESARSSWREELSEKTDHPYVDVMPNEKTGEEKKAKKKEEVKEGYKGKHGQTDKEYADSRSQGGKMVSGDSTMSGSEYTHGRRVKAENPGMQPDVGGKTKPKSQGKMDKGTRADLDLRKANLRREEFKLTPNTQFREGAEKPSAMDLVKKSLPKGALIDTKKQPKRQHWSKEHMRKDVDPKRYDKKND